jgi:3-deoxy-manno-octulosonate cytidylyltransferase (CMP-KDO synthetase)
MVEWVYRAAKRAKSVDRVIVATDNERILDAVKGFGGEAVMTSEGCRSGTERIAEAVETLSLSADIIVNIQGDEPLIEPELIDATIRPLIDDATVVMSTAKTKIAESSELNNPNAVKVVTDSEGFALYFSRSLIPYARDEVKRLDTFKHIGLYVYSRDTLLRLARLAPTPLELSESLEQLRALENGIRIKVVETSYNPLSVDTPEDLEDVRALFNE